MLDLDFMAVETGTKPGDIHGAVTGPVRLTLIRSVVSPEKSVSPSAEVLLLCKCGAKADLRRFLDQLAGPIYPSEEYLSAESTIAFSAP